MTKSGTEKKRIRRSVAQNAGKDSSDTNSKAAQDGGHRDEALGVSFVEGNLGKIEDEVFGDSKHNLPELGLELVLLDSVVSVAAKIEFLEYQDLKRADLI